MAAADSTTGRSKPGLQLTGRTRLACLAMTFLVAGLALAAR